MKAYSADLQTALASGSIISAGALRVSLDPTPALVWSGRAPLVLDGETYTGLGQGIVHVTGGQLGAAAQAIDVTLPSLDPDVIPMFEDIDLRRAPVVLWRVFFDSSGANLLDAHVFARGRVDGFALEETPGGPAKLSLRIETAARGQGRQTGRMRADADQRLVEGADGAFRWLTAAPSRLLAWGGKPPAHARAALPNVGFFSGGFERTDVL